MHAYLPFLHVRSFQDLQFFCNQFFKHSKLSNHPSIILTTWMQPHTILVNIQRTSLFDRLFHFILHVVEHQCNRYNIDVLPGIQLLYCVQTCLHTSYPSVARFDGFHMRYMPAGCMRAWTSSITRFSSGRAVMVTSYCSIYDKDCKVCTIGCMCAHVYCLRTSIHYVGSLAMIQYSTSVRRCWW